jgi:AAA+ ATPase superfamily predicted ATPase
VIIGRKKEQKLLQKIYDSDQSEFAVVYGRRHIGKTFLVREFFLKQGCIYFQAMGIQKRKMATQLKKITEALFSVFFNSAPLAIPGNWDNASVFDKVEAESLRKKIDTFKERTKTMKQIFIVFISASGLRETSYSKEMVVWYDGFECFFLWSNLI